MFFWPGFQNPRADARRNSTLTGSWSSPYEMTRPTGSSIASTGGSARSTALFQTRIVGGGTTAAGRPQYAASADGRFLINVPAGDSAKTPITLILNWHPERAK